MPELQQLRADHAAAVLAFETENRAWFAASVSDRGDDFFDNFAEGFDTLLTDQQRGLGVYHVLVDGGSVVGRFNMSFLDDGAANLGYRMAQAASGRGLATAAVHELCSLAATRYGLRLIRANTSLANRASQKVLTNAGFTLVGPADPADVGGKQGYLYERVLAADPEKS